MIRQTIKAIIPNQLLSKYWSWQEFNQLGQAAKTEVREDNNGRFYDDCGASECIKYSADWLLASQRFSKSKDGGYSRDYSLVSGWSTSYPETTGYIIPTMINCGHLFDDTAYIDSARKALDWLERIQLDSGAYQGGKIDAEPVPVTFNTGQILIGLAAGVKEFGCYIEATHKAAEWLVNTLDDDGCWRQFPTPFARQGEKAYETHVSWGLLEAARATGESRYGDAALKNIDWALTKQHDNGWFQDCCLDQPAYPLTHTLGYVLRGVVEGYLYSREEKYLKSAVKTADALSGLVNDVGYLPGRIDCNLKPAVSWVCLTGSVQIAHSLLLLYRETENESYLQKACALNAFVRKTVSIDHDDRGIRGAVKGSFPVSGDYGKYQFLNWAAKFFIDSNLLEEKIKA